MKRRMSFLNRMLLPLAPRLACRREAWRLLARSAYTAEDASPRSAGWDRTNRTGEAANQAGRDVIRARARDLERNSDVMEAILGAMERNVVGTGFVLQAKFQFTPPRGGRQLIAYHILICHVISIHAPAWGATSLFLM